ncbi:MAG TPA: FliH/SctL family protein [Polyangiaceae bacterium]|nr:FliH/SctL family protein [Polyangiaceae bacterium]
MPSSKSERAPAARFLDVTRGKLRAPSWVASQRAGFRRISSEPNLKAPKIPADLEESLSEKSPVEAMPEGAPPPGAGIPLDRPASIAELVAEIEAASQAPRHLQSVLPEEPQPEPDPALTDAFVAATDALARAREIVLKDSAEEVVELAITIARRVIGRELATDPSVVERLVREGLASLGQHDRVTVRLGRAFSHAGTAIERALTASEERVEIVLDASLEEYGCVIETELGRVDESIESRLSALLSALESDSNPPGH